MIAQLLIGLAAFSQSAIAVPESAYSQIYSLVKARGQAYNLGSFNGVGGIKISYVKYAAGPSTNGCVLVSPGQGEPALKYLELAFDLGQQGFGPVFVIDHRGQGLSDRILPDRQKGYVASFSDYVNDLDYFASDIFVQDSDCASKAKFLLAHSMGGAIAAAYLEKAGTRSPFRRAVLSAPMLKLQLKGKTENRTLWETFGACYTPFGPACTDFVPGGGPFDPKRVFAGNLLTHSEARFVFNQKLRIAIPETQLGSPTVNWVREGIKAGIAMRDPSNVKKIATPVLILQAGVDSYVDNSGQEEFCASHPGCRIAKFPESFHEVLMEIDSIRDPALAATVNFFKQ